MPEPVCERTLNDLLEIRLCACACARQTTSAEQRVSAGGMDTVEALTKPHPPKLHATIARDSEGLGLGLVSETERVHRNHPPSLGTRIALARLARLRLRVVGWLSRKSQ